MGKFKAIVVAILLSISASTAFALDIAQCTEKGGIIVTESGDNSGCIDGKNIGSVSGMRCQCICCVGEKIIDCKVNTVEIYDACDAGNELRYKIKITGEIPEFIYFRLGNGNGAWSGEAQQNGILHNGETQSVQYTEDNRNKNYTQITDYRIHYKNYPRTECNYNLSQKQPTISVRQCKQK